MSNILHLETATKACSVAVSENGKLLATREILNDSYSHGEQLTLLITEVMQEANLEYAKLSAVSVTSGPGSYTGLRIGVSTAKGLCYTLRIPLIFVNALESLASAASQKYTNQKICAMLDARRMEVYSAIYTADGETLKPVSADILEPDTYGEFEPFVACGDGTGKVQALWKGRNIVFDTEIHSSAVGQIETAWKRFQENEFEDVAYSEPFYLKEFQTGAKQQ